MLWHLVSVIFPIFFFFGCHANLQTNKDITNNGTFQQNSGNGTNVEHQTNHFFNGSRIGNNTLNKGRSFDASFTKTGFSAAEGNKIKMPLDDLSLDDVPMLTHGTSTPSTTQQLNNSTQFENSCKEGSKIYKIGEKFNRGCNESCECDTNGQIICGERCKPPFQAKGLARNDAFCREIPSEDNCCVVVQCTQDTEVEPLEGCVHKNQSFHRGDMFNDGCEAVCSCGEGGKIRCKPRCPQTRKNGSEQCVQVPDPADPCCTVTFCDVTLGDQDTPKIGTEETLENSELKLRSADALNSTSAIIHFWGEPELESNLTAEISLDQIKWNKTELDGLVVHNLEPEKMYYIRIISGGLVSNAVSIILPKTTSIFFVTPKTEEHMNNSSSTIVTVTQNTTADNITGEEFCIFKNKNYTIGEEFNDACISYCICTETGVDCSPIECPSDFGLDVLDPTCLKWETKPENFNPVPPNCCPDKVRCLDNGSCNFMGEVFPNWADIPSKISGCEKRCYCEFGNVTCQDVCPPVPASPPPELACPPQQAMLHHLPGDDCCLIWVCPQVQHIGGSNLPQNFVNLPGQQHLNQNGVIVQILEPLDEHTVRLAFSVPSLLVGLHGRVEVRYTANKHDQDPSTWELQVLAPPHDLIATPQLHFDLGNLLPDTTYSIIIKIILRDLSNMPQSPVLTVKTLPSSNPTKNLPSHIPIDADLTATDVNSTWVLLNWRKFTQFELQFIDGVQLQYKDDQEKMYLETPLIHRSVTSYTIEGLKPNCSYEVKLYLIPFPGQPTELQSERSLQFQTTSLDDPYDFNISLDVLSAKSSSIEVTWNGVPYPDDKYINIYRIVYKSETGKEDYNSFKVAKRDSVPKVMLTNLKPVTRYTVWVEAYLKNGRLKRSNEKQFVTKSGPIQPAGPSLQGKLSGTPPPMEPGDYYGPLVAVAIIAALAIMAALILLLVLMKKHGQNKATITSRSTQSAYDNPSYKTCEGDQQTVATNGVVGNGVVSAADL